MLSRDSLQATAVQWQTTFSNVAREYLQHVFLSYLYQAPAAERLAFKGGTALRVLYGSPRFSQDLDFSGTLKAYHVGRLLTETVQKVSGEALPFQTEEANPTSGGYLALYRCVLYEVTLRLELNISLRAKDSAEPVLVTTPLHPSYQCLRLPTLALCAEKLQALLFRKKPRDFFDLYFLLRQRLGLEAIIPLKQRLLREIASLDAKHLQRELKVFLPVSHHRTIANLPRALQEELLRL